MAVISDLLYVSCLMQCLEASMLQTPDHDTFILFYKISEMVATLSMSISRCIAFKLQTAMNLTNYSSI